MQTTHPAQQCVLAALPWQATSPEKLPGIRHLITVGSNKGDVGRSTVSVNLARALAQSEAGVGLGDADILDPRIPGMLGILTGESPKMTQGSRIIPVQRYGLKVMSMDMLTGNDKTAVLREPMVGRYRKIFVAGVQWDKLAYLIIDLSPGPVDTQLTLAQNLPLSGMVSMMMPQSMNLKTARCGLRLFEKVQILILGIVETMRRFTGSHCGESTDIFRHGGSEQMSQEIGVLLLGTSTLYADVGTCGDEDRLIIAEQLKSASARVYAIIAVALVGHHHAAVATLKLFVWRWNNNEKIPAWLETTVQPAGARNASIGHLRHDPRTLYLLWEDSHRDDFDVRDLRPSCHCALCVEKMRGRKLLDSKTLRPDIGPRQIVSEGNYAIRFDWNNSFSLNSGLHAFNDRRALGERTTAKIIEMSEALTVDKTYAKPTLVEQPISICANKAILGHRSAIAIDGSAAISRSVFVRMLTRLIPRPPKPHRLLEKSEINLEFCWQRMPYYPPRLPSCLLQKGALSSASKHRSLWLNHRFTVGALIQERRLSLLSAYNVKEKR
jgi:ATP-binding protein involved in chromosome partitioning